jgi:prepilin-type N-terminal cleavage/methylation domain-containing protein
MINDQSFHKVIKPNKLSVLLRKAKNEMRKTKSEVRSAFTLLELLLVIAVIAVLAGVVLFNLNPAQRLEDANNTKVLNTANDIEKAIKIYSVENSGNLPSSLQSITTSGIYDICKSGQTTGCINLDELVTGGKLSFIPEDNRYSTTYKSGYKLDFNPTKAESKVYSQSEYEQVTKYCPPGDNCLPPVAEWLFEQTNGTTALDTSGNNMNATLTNGSSWSDGKYGNASILDGVNDYVQVNNNALINNMSQSTISFWIKLNSLSSSQIPISKDGDSGYYIQINSNGQPYIRYGSAVTHVGSVGTITTGTWTYLTMVYNGSTLVLYKNGVLLSGSSSGTPPVSQDDKLWIGGYSANGGAAPNSYFVNGLIDNTRIYNYARTPEQIAWEYNEGLPYAHWKFDESSGTIAYDSSGNSKNATLINGATFSSGKYGNAITLGGINDYLTVASMGSFNKFTVTAWIKTSTGTLNNIVSGSGAAIYSSIRSNKLSWFDGISWRDGTTTLTDGQWKHVAFIFANGAHYMYVNGNIEYNNNAGNGSYTSGSIGYIGAVYTPDRYFNGQIDDMKVYNYALTKSQIMQSMHEI